MKIKFALLQLLLLAALCFTACKSANEQKLPLNIDDSILQNKHKWLKDYALCSCIKYAFKEDDSIKNDLTFSVLIGISDYGYPRVYHIIDSASKKAALSIEPSQIVDFDGKKALLLGCINYYESAQLDSLVKSFDSMMSAK
jgi:hypothetical protein